MSKPKTEIRIILLVYYSSTYAETVLLCCCWYWLTTIRHFTTKERHWILIHLKGGKSFYGKQKGFFWISSYRCVKSILLAWNLIYIAVLFFSYHFHTFDRPYYSIWRWLLKWCTLGNSNFVLKKCSNVCCVV